jgi:uncharacterized protein YukE
LDGVRVDTAQLRAAASGLRCVAELATEAGDRSSRVASLVPELGAEQAIQAVAEFLSCWHYGLRCIAKQAEQTGHDLTIAATAYESAEASLTTALGGAVTPPAAGWTAPHVPDPVPVRWHASALMAPPVQLSAATHASQLIPGEPLDSERLGRMLGAFADDAEEALARLRPVSSGTWVGGAAAVTQAEVAQLKKRLDDGAEAFRVAGPAVGKYATTHAESRARAAQALRMCQSVAPAPGAPTEDPDGTLARAGAILAEARHDLDNAARVLWTALEEARKSAPSEPGFLAGLKHAIKSLVEGAFDSFAELGPAAVELAELAVKLDPARAVYDPRGYVAAQESFYGGMAHALEHPVKFAEAVADWDTLTTDPAKWIGKLLPDLLLLGPAMAKEGALRGAESEERLATAQAAVEEAERAGALNNVFGAGAADERLAELGLRTDGIAGSAGRDQLALLSNPDEWMPTRLHAGDLIAVADHGKIIVPIEGELTTYGREFYEAVQKAPRRLSGLDGVPTKPQILPGVRVFRVSADMDAARAMALANEQFGTGGGTLLSVGDFDDAVDNGRLIPTGEHRFSPDTLVSDFEDPRYRHVDPSLPTHALDPDHEEILGRWAEARKHARDVARNATLVATEEVANEPAERGAR